MATAEQKAEQKARHADALRAMAEDWAANDPQAETRRDFILRWKAAGMTFQEIADATGVTRQWVRMLAKSAGEDMAGART
jgi:transcriptional regulator